MRPGRRPRPPSGRPGRRGSRRCARCRRGPGRGWPRADVGGLQRRLEALGRHFAEELAQPRHAGFGDDALGFELGLRQRAARVLDDLAARDLDAETALEPEHEVEEVDRLLDARLVTEKTFGRARLIQVNSKHLLYESVKQLVSYSYGPLAVLPSALYSIDGLERAFIYGPYAAHLKHELGPDLHEVDLLLIGYMNRIEASKAAERVEGYLGRAVNVQFVGSQEWLKGETDFVKEVRSRPLVELDLNL